MFRCQRVASCFASLFLCMLTNAMWYGSLQTTPTITTTPNTITLDSTLLSLGPISLSQEELIVGSCSTLLALPLILLIVTLFKYARPFALRGNRIARALQSSSAPSPMRPASALPHHHPPLHVPGLVLRDHLRQ